MIHRIIGFPRWAVRRWLGIEAKSPIDETLSYQNRTINGLKSRMDMAEARLKYLEKREHAPGGYGSLKL